MSSETLLVEHAAGVMTLTLNRPAALNSLAPSLVDALDEACAAIEVDDAVRVVLLRGSGRAFCAGGDLQAAMAAEAAEPGAAARYFDSISAVLRRIERLPMPVVAAIHGWAVAGGLEIALCCDLVVAADSARFGDAHARYGLIPGGGGSARLPRRIGSGPAKWLMYTAEPVSADQMQRWGLVQLVVPASDLEAAARGLAESLTQRSPQGLRAMKRLVDAQADHTLDEALALESKVSADHVASGGADEGWAAFAEKRQPDFG
ncbi:enoyl-CoA hydratase/isomerase family protein [Pseudonocardia yuanmonensis]|uniref:Enoyl-CoA hydratase/isomerase family protein n=1 Tax=Pseudonocardia yuanmonensis TaxID=1095914 RepID=A0ABP8XMH5_9PSEU